MVEIHNSNKQVELQPAHSDTHAIAHAASDAAVKDSDDLKAQQHLEHHLSGNEESKKSAQHGVAQHLDSSNPPEIVDEAAILRKQYSELAQGLGLDANATNAQISQAERAINLGLSSTASELDINAKRYAV